MSRPVDVGRREFLVRSAALGGAMVLGFHLPGPTRAALVEGQAGATREVNAWILIDADDTVTIRVARSEMGQGIFTALPQLVAEELECDWNRVRAEYAAASENLQRDQVFGAMLTGGSRSVRQSHDYLRKAGAAAREMLIAAAAARWGVDASECSAAASLVRHAASGRQLRYGELAGEAARRRPPEVVFLKEPADWKLIGRPVKRLDTADKVAGKPVFGTDVQLPGMLHAAIRACPVFGGTLRSVDAAAVSGLPGIQAVVTLADAVAVVADDWWRAAQAVAALPVIWNEGPGAAVDDAELRADLATGLASPDAKVGRADGDPDAVLAAAARLIEAEYYAPYLAHATMEPMTCTARVAAGRVEVWVPTQNAMAALEAAATAAGVPPAQVEVHNTMLGGGFGRRGAFQDYVEQAVRIAARVGRPVKLLWSREEDMRHDFYRPASMAAFKAGIDAKGQLTALTARVAAPSILHGVRPASVQDGMDPLGLQGLADHPYAIDHFRADYAMRNSHVPVGFWRSVNHSQNTYFRECFMDEIARALGQDPYTLRQRLLAQSPKQRAVLHAAAEHAGWERPAPPGVYRGIAVETSYGSHCAQVVEVRMQGEGRFRILRVVCAIDPGHVVNPDTVEAQVESAIVYGLSAALFGAITIERGRVVQGNFDDYPMLLLRDMPAVETVSVPSGDFWGGMGEPPLPPIAPALCNALYAATGKPIRALPLSGQGLRLA